MGLTGTDPPDGNGGGTVKTSKEGAGQMTGTVTGVEVTATRLGHTQDNSTATEGQQIENLSTGSVIGDLLVGEIPYVGTGVDLANAAIDYQNGNYGLMVLVLFL